MGKKSTVRADRIKALLKENGLTMKYFNDKFGKNRSFLSNVLSGSDNIGESQIAFLAKALHTTPEYLKGETDIKEKPVAETGDGRNKELLDLFERLTEDQRQMLIRQIKGILSDE